MIDLQNQREIEALQSLVIAAFISDIHDAETCESLLRQEVREALELQEEAILKAVLDGNTELTKGNGAMNPQWKRERLECALNRGNDEDQISDIAKEEIDRKILELGQELPPDGKE